MSTNVNATPAEAWLHPLAVTPTPSLSERLIRGLEAHLADEAHDAAACEELANRIDHPVARFLLTMIVDDARRHEAVLRSMIARLHEETDFTAAPGDSLIPRSDAHGPIADAEKTASVVRMLIRDEHEGARHVRHLARQDPTAYDGLYPLLLETIARDSEKHATVLQFILRQIDRGQ